MKKRLLCLFMSICMCLSLSLFAHAENIEGPITTEPIVTQPTLEVSSVPQGAVAVGKVLKENHDLYPTKEKGDINYYRVSGATMSLTNNVPTYVPGYSPNGSQTILNNVYSPSAVIGAENRVQVTNTEQMPYSAIIYLEVEFPNKTQNDRATAFLISENVALTTAHNLYDEAEGGWAEIKQIVPGKNGASFFNNPYGSCDAIEIVVSAPWYESRNIDYDWGLILLDESIGSETGYLGFQFIPRSMIGMNVILTGYPNASEYRYYQWTHSGVIEIPDLYADLPQENLDYFYEYIITYEIDASGGQSGAPIYYLSDAGSWIAVGIHTNEVRDKITGEPLHNEGLRFTSSLYSFVLAFRSQY